MITLPQCFSALFASGCGDRCNNLRQMLHLELLCTDEESGKTRSELYKFGKENYPDTHKVLRETVAAIVKSTIFDVDIFYFGEDFTTEQKDRSNIKFSMRKTIQETYLKNNKFNIENLIKKSPFILDADESYDVFVFRRLIEAAMKMGLWNGSQGEG